MYGLAALHRTPTVALKVTPSIADHRDALYSSKGFTQPRIAQASAMFRGWRLS